MSRDFDRLSTDELAEELASLEDGLVAEDIGHGRLKSLVRNLRIHRIELEMQNRELRDTQRALEEAKDRYADLYDFAPIGYATLDGQGMIREINLTGARLLGCPRTELVGRPLAGHLEAGQSGGFFRHLQRVFDDDARATAEIRIKGEHGARRWLLLESTRAHNDGATWCRTAMVDVTEGRLADEARRETEMQLATIADNVPVLIAYVDADRRYVFNNAAYERWFGHSRDYIRGRRMREILGDDVYASIRHHVDAALAGEEVHYEAQLEYREAGARYVSTSYIPHMDAAGSVVGFFVLISDLTERRRAERALVEEQRFVSAVLDTAGALVLVIDRDGCIVRFNRECERVSGYRVAEVQGKRFDMLLPPDERAAVEEVFERLSGGEFPSTHENCWMAKDGTRSLIAWSNTALMDPGGRVTHVVATGIDITDRRRIEDDLRHREQQLRLVTDAVPVLIAYIDRDMRFRVANAAYQTWFGLDPEQMIGRRVADLMEEEAVSVMRPHARRALAGKEVFYENSVHHRTRGRRDVSANLVPDRDADGAVRGYFSVIMDITERKRNEELDKLRLLEAAHADRLSTMGEIATGIAHELNQPLTAISTTADVLVAQAGRLGGKEDGAVTEALGQISNQAHRAADIVRHLRTFARRREPEFAVVGLKQAVENALSLVRVEARGKNVRIDTDLGGSPVEADPVLVEQLIVNLVRNAVDATAAAGTASPRITLRAKESDGMVKVTVSDNGPGLSREDLRHLFEPFYTTKSEGMGLGLAICRSIVEAHGGRMWADNARGGGARFVFSLNAAADGARTSRAE